MLTDGARRARAKCNATRYVNVAPPYAYTYTVAPGAPDGSRGAPPLALRAPLPLRLCACATCSRRPARSLIYSIQWPSRSRQLCRCFGFECYILSPLYHLVAPPAQRLRTLGLGKKFYPPPYSRLSSRSGPGAGESWPAAAMRCRRESKG
eukprot:scaffold24912_cov109-Isochrysis_galbana.AAC.2